MNPLDKLVNWLKGPSCEKLVKRTANEIKFSAAVDEIFSFEFSNKVKQLIQSTKLAVSLDDQQYFLCQTIKNEDDKSFANELKRIRIMLIMGITQLRNILSSIEQVKSEELEKELTKWIRYMNKLNKESIESLKPERRGLTPKGKSKNNLDEIRKYQEIDEDELSKAIGLI